MKGTRPKTYVERIWTSLVMVERFWSRVQKTPGCWLWRGSHIGTGYGNIGIAGTRHNITAHRLSWMIANQEELGDRYVIHTCDNRGCVRPDHLIAGTQKENMQDAMRKGRTTWGSKNSRAKLTRAEVERIREISRTGLSSGVIGKQFQISDSQVQRIANGTTWKPEHMARKRDAEA